MSGLPDDGWEISELWQHPRIIELFAGRDPYLRQHPHLEIVLGRLASIGTVELTFRRRGRDTVADLVAVCILRRPGRAPVIVDRPSPTTAALRCLLLALELLDAERDAGLADLDDLLSRH